MAKINDPKLLALYKALDLVQDEIRRDIAFTQEQIGKPHLSKSRTQEEHDDHCRRDIAQAEAASKWVFIRMMRIDPD